MSSAAPALPVNDTTLPASPWTAAARICLPPALAAAAWHLLLVGCFVLPFGDVSALLCVSQGHAGRWPYEAVHVGLGKDGFDGQFYYALARDPWHVHGEPIDAPCYRHARILYPALAWLLSGGGDPVRLLWAMPAINVLAAAGLAWLGALLSWQHGRSPWWGSLLPVVVNVALPSMRDLTDPLAALTACGLLTAWLLRRPGWAVFAWAAAAMLTREQNAVVALIVLAAALYHRRWGPAAGLAAGLALVAGWYAALTAAYGVSPFTGHNFGAPLAGALECWRNPNAFAYRTAAVVQGAGLAFVATQVALSVAVAFLRVNRTVKLVALAGALLAVVASGAVYGDEWSYLRVFYWMPLAVWVGSIVSGLRWPMLLLTPAVLWPALEIGHVLRVWLK